MLVETTIYKLNNKTNNMKKQIFSLILLGVLCSIGNAWGQTTNPTGAAHKPGDLAGTNLVSANNRKYEVYFSNNGSKESLLIGSNTSANTQATSTTNWCNIGSSCGADNNNISTAFTIHEFQSNVKGDNKNKTIKVQGKD